jgi:hypothetical protein
MAGCERMKAFEDGLLMLLNHGARRLSPILPGWFLWELTLLTGSKVLFVINEEGVHISYHLVSHGDGDKTRAFQADMRMALYFSRVTLNYSDFTLVIGVAAIRTFVTQMTSEEDGIMIQNREVQLNFSQQNSTRLSITLDCAYRLPNLP